jgi:hypothetical protein
MADCPACGAPVEDGLETCPACGARVEGATASFEPVGVEVPVPEPQHADDGPVLVVRKGPQPGERFYVDRQKLSIGRDPEADIFLNDMTVSRAHALVECIGDEVRISDAGSLNGTYVNGEIVENTLLKDGDVIQIGTFQMVFVGRVGHP